MNVYPIIHTRTYKCDFNPDFSIRPDFFQTADIKWARQHVLGATASIDSLQGERWLVADNEKFRMAGIVSFIKNIYEKITSSKDGDTSAQKLFCDNKGRLVYAFIGIVINKSECTNWQPGELPFDSLWKMYNKSISPIWEGTSQETKLSRSFDLEFNTYKNLKIDIPTYIENKSYYESNITSDYNLFCYYLNYNSSNYSFCSNINDYKTAQDTIFDCISTSRNNITRLERANANKSYEKESIINLVQSNNEQQQLLEFKNKEEFFEFLKKTIEKWVICIENDKYVIEVNSHTNFKKLRKVLGVVKMHDSYEFQLEKSNEN